MAEQIPPTKANPTPTLRKLGHFVSNLLIVGVIRLALALPFEFRVRFMGWLVEHAIGYKSNEKMYASFSKPLDSPKTIFIIIYDKQ